MERLAFFMSWGIGEKIGLRWAVFNEGLARWEVIDSLYFFISGLCELLVLRFFSNGV